MVEGRGCGLFFVKDRPGYFARDLGAYVKGGAALMRLRLVQQILAPIFVGFMRCAEHTLHLLAFKT